MTEARPQATIAEKGPLMNPSKLKIVWQESEARLNDELLGHGVEYHDRKIRARRKSLVAFLDGFEWLHGVSNEVLIHCIKPNRVTTEAVLQEMKERIEAAIAKGEIPHGRITARIEGVGSF